MTLRAVRSLVSLSARKSNLFSVDLRPSQNQMKEKVRVGTMTAIAMAAY